MMKVAMWLTAVLVLLAGGMFAYQRAFAGEGHSDCPGTIVFPINGQEVCKDRCPLVGSERTDCPGKIVCPITGEPICADQCPTESGKAEASGTRACCSVAQRQ